jgi:hypothetical protein
LKVSETFWLTAVGEIQDLAILICVILFTMIPSRGRLLYRELGALLIVSLITDVIAWTGVLVFHTNMNMAGSVFNILKLPIVVMLYRNQVSWRNRDVIAYSVIIPFIIFALINLLFFQGVRGMNSLTASLSSFCIIVMSMTYAFGHAQKVPTESRIKLPMYWINMGLLFYHITTIYLYVWADYLIKVLKSNLINVWMVHNALGIVFYAILCYALTLVRAEYNKDIPA